MVLPFFSPPTLILLVAGPEETKNLAGEGAPPDSDPCATQSLAKMSLTCQINPTYATIYCQPLLLDVRMPWFILGVVYVGLFFLLADKKEK